MWTLFADVLYEDWRPVQQVEKNNGAVRKADSSIFNTLWITFSAGFVSFF